MDDDGEEEEEEEEAETELGLELMSGHTNSGRHATVGSEIEELQGSKPSNFRHDSPSLMAQSSGPRHSSRTSDKVDNVAFGEFIKCQ